MSTARVILVCQNRTCRRQGSAKVLTALQENAIANVEVKPTGCLGQCGNGPMVLVLPEQIWYSGIVPDEIPLLVQQHRW